MADLSRDLLELKREVVEARNQAIKTDHLMKNLSLDIKEFEKRFDLLERRTRWVNAAAHILVAGAIVFAAYSIVSVKSRHFNESMAALKADLETERQNAQVRSEELRKHSSQLEKESHQQAQAEEQAIKVLEALDDKQEAKAGTLLEQLESEHLSPLSRRLVDKRLTELRRKIFDSALKEGRAQYTAKQYDNAVTTLRKAVALDGDLKSLIPTQVLLANALWALKRYDEAEPLLRDLLKLDLDKTVNEQTRFLLAATLAHQGRREAAKTLFEEIMAGGGSYATAAKNYDQALVTGAELPDDLPFTPGKTR
jgi:tetratricopeptide (TPR) repeat protein